MSSSSEKRLKFRSSQGEVVEVERQVAVKSLLIKEMVGIYDLPQADDASSDEPILISNVNTNTLKTVFDWCQNHKDDPPTVEVQENDSDSSVQLMESDKELIKEVTGDPSKLAELLMAADFMQVTGLCDMLIKATADMIRGKTPDQIRKLLNIRCDFTDEEQAQIERETAWCNDK